MTKIEEAKIEILNELKAKERVIAIEFDNTIGKNGSGFDEKPMGWRFYRLNIFHMDKNGEATFSAKGVYIKTTTGKHYLHSGGVQTKSLVAEEVIEEPIEEPE